MLPIPRIDVVDGIGRVEKPAWADFKLPEGYIRAQHQTVTMLASIKGTAVAAPRRRNGVERFDPLIEGLSDRERMQMTTGLSTDEHCNNDRLRRKAPTFVPVSTLVLPLVPRVSKHSQHSVPKCYELYRELVDDDHVNDTSPEDSENGQVGNSRLVRAQEPRSNADAVSMAVGAPVAPRSSSLRHVKEREQRRTTEILQPPTSLIAKRISELTGHTCDQVPKQRFDPLDPRVKVPIREEIENNGTRLVLDDLPIPNDKTNGQKSNDAGSSKKSLSDSVPECVDYGHDGIYGELGELGDIPNVSRLCLNHPGADAATTRCSPPPPDADHTADHDTIMAGSLDQDMSSNRDDRYSETSPMDSDKAEVVDTGKISP
jgi:hypothetical protein